MVSVSEIAVMTNPHQLQVASARHNWNDGFLVPWAIADHPRCDLAVALTLFWLSDAIALLTGEVGPSPYNQDWLNFSQSLVNRILDGQYKEGAGAFKPDLGRLQIENYRRLGIPNVLLTSIPGSGLPRDA